MHEYSEYMLWILCIFVCFGRLSCCPRMANWSFSWSGSLQQIVAVHRLHHMRRRNEVTSTTVTRTSKTSLAWRHLTSNRCCWLRMTSSSLGCQCISLCFLFQIWLFGQIIRDGTVIDIYDAPASRKCEQFFSLSLWALVWQVRNTFNVNGLKSCHVLSTHDFIDLIRLPLVLFVWCWRCLSCCFDLQRFQMQGSGQKRRPSGI